MGDIHATRQNNRSHHLVLCKFPGNQEDDNLCEMPVARSNLVDLRQRGLAYSSRDGDDAVQKARPVADAERYYRLMYVAVHKSWYLRDRHMFVTLQRILERAEPAKAVIWAHTSHIGDARFTDMGSKRGELNIGHRCLGIAMGCAD